MKSKKMDDGKWWITEMPECNECEVCEQCPSCQDVGPYDTKAETEDDRKGLARTERSGKRRDFWTTEKKRKK